MVEQEVEYKVKGNMYAISSLKEKGLIMKLRFVILP